MKWPVTAASDKKTIQKDTMNNKSSPITDKPHLRIKLHKIFINGPAYLFAYYRISPIKLNIIRPTGMDIRLVLSVLFLTLSWMEECGATVLCAAEPSSCDPSQPGSCFFLGAKLTSGRNFEFSLSGESEGYLAASLSTDATVGSNDPTYICANNNGIIRFFAALLNNGVLTETTLEVNNVKGSVNGNKIQCTFAATVPDASRSRRSLSTRAQSFAMSVSTGPYNSTSDDLGSPTPTVQTNVVNIANPTEVITNLAVNTTTATPNTTHAVTLQQSTNTAAAKTTAATAKTTVAAKTTAATAKTTAATAKTTAAPTTTTAAPLIPDTNVTTLATSVSREECGATVLCAAEPSSCDPSQPGSCFFLGAKLTSGRNFEFSLSGESDGYLAASLSTDATVGGNDPTYICANNNGVIKFFGALLNNGVLTVTTLEVNNVKGSVNGTKIQCTFAATVPAVSRSRRSLSTRAQSFAMSVSTGPYNSTSDDLGSPTPTVQTNVVNIANPTDVITNLAVNTTTATPNTTHAVTLQQSTNTAAAKTTAAAAKTTAAPATTTAGPLIPDTNVTTLATSVSREECGATVLCAAEPSSCDPSQSGSCFFLGAKLTSGRNFEFSLSGESDGYLAASLSTDATVGGNDPTYICANDNGVIKFFGALLNNGVLTVTTLEVNNVKGSVNGNKIQCTFAATVPAVSRSRRSLSTRAQSFAMSVSTGPFDSTSDTPLGSPIPRVQTNVVNIANPNAVITLVTPTTSHAVTLQQSLMQALLVTVGVLGLAML
ncbi:mucin-1-like [Scomber scombrus]|uniref:Mucin-1-like n=1 Tax=Scomber scombrus TaxID=13677 RepID=A0AAV1PXE1_SCOSC